MDAAVEWNRNHCSGKNVLVVVGRSGVGGSARLPDKPLILSLIHLFSCLD